MLIPPPADYSEQKLIRFPLAVSKQIKLYD